MGKQRDVGKEQVWRVLIGRWRRSAQTIGAFCGDHEVSTAAFHYWQRTIAQRDRQSAEVVPAFVPIDIPAMSAGNGLLEIVLGCGRVVRVPAGFDADTLRQLLAVLEAPAC